MYIIPLPVISLRLRLKQNVTLGTLPLRSTRSTPPTISHTKTVTPYTGRTPMIHSIDLNPVYTPRPRTKLRYTADRSGTVRSMTPSATTTSHPGWLNNSAISPYHMPNLVDPKEAWEILVVIKCTHHSQFRTLKVVSTKAGRDHIHRHSVNPASILALRVRNSSKQRKNMRIAFSETIPGAECARPGESYWHWLNRRRLGMRGWLHLSVNLLRNGSALIWRNILT